MAAQWQNPTHAVQQSQRTSIASLQSQVAAGRGVKALLFQPAGGGSMAYRRLGDREHD